MPMPDVRRASIGGIETRVLQTTGGSGPPLLLLHGFTDSADTWRRLLEEPAVRSRTAQAPDLPGAGQADRLPPGPLLPALDGFVAAAITACTRSEGPPVVAGNSLGGLLALRAACSAELPLAGACVISPAGLTPASPRAPTGPSARVPPVSPRWSRLIPSPQARRRAVDLGLELPVPALVVRTVVGRIYRHWLGADRELAALYRGHFDGMRDIRRYAELARRLRAEIDASPLATERLRHPVLFVWGRNDPPDAIDRSYAVAQALPGSAVARLDCGHCAQMERPAELADLLCRAPPWG